ncbi:MAG: hypothetical protein LBU34_03995 [Planctomycetaceae bacterium]|jgi:hypothetical protein|nr:hypothetical protein [Planctomycetaceae bacterium]
MQNKNIPDMPQEFLTFTLEPLYFYTGVPWEVSKRGDCVSVSTKKMRWGCIVIPICIIIFSILCLSYLFYHHDTYTFLKTFLIKNITPEFENIIPEPESNSDAKIISQGLLVTAFVLLLIALIIFALYCFDFYIWKNPRFVFNVVTKDISFFNGEICYTSSLWQEIRIVSVSGYNFTPHLKVKYAGNEHLYVCILDNFGLWHRYMIAVQRIIESSISAVVVQNNIEKLQRLIGCDVISVRYSLAQPNPERTICVHKYCDFQKKLK